MALRGNGNKGINRNYFEIKTENIEQEIFAVLKDIN